MSEPINLQQYTDGVLPELEFVFLKPLKCRQAEPAPAEAKLLGLWVAPLPGCYTNVLIPDCVGMMSATQFYHLCCGFNASVHLYIFQN